MCALSQTPGRDGREHGSMAAEGAGAQKAPGAQTPQGGGTQLAPRLPPLASSFLHDWGQFTVKDWIYLSHPVSPLHPGIFVLYHNGILQSTVLSLH